MNKRTATGAIAASVAVAAGGAAVAQQLDPTGIATETTNYLLSLGLPGVVIIGCVVGWWLERQTNKALRVENNALRDRIEAIYEKRVAAAEKEIEAKLSLADGQRAVADTLKMISEVVGRSNHPMLPGPKG